MALQGSGAISINNINVELGKAGTTTSSLGQADFRTLAGVASGAISMSNFYGKSKYISASGGTITTYGNYRVHTFTSSGTFTVSQVGDITGNIDYLIVAGGGGGGSAGSRGKAGGAGGGGLLVGTFTPTETSYTITIGGGGSGGVGGHRYGYNGGNSSAFGLTAIGGGGGGGGENTSWIYGQYGGSGGGGGEYYGYGSGAGGVSGQGNSGAAAYNVGSYSNGGGGGGRNSAASGQNPGAAYPSTLRTSATEYYAQGGYGNYYDSNTGTAGGTNTGYGGGGNYSTDGSNGGSGIVIIRYQISG